MVADRVIPGRKFDHKCGKLFGTKKCRETGTSVENSEPENKLVGWLKSAMPPPSQKRQLADFDHLALPSPFGGPGDGRLKQIGSCLVRWMSHRPTSIIQFDPWRFAGPMQSPYSCPLHP